MADSRRQTRSTWRWEQQTDAQFWSNQPDPLLIERGQADAIRLVRSTVNTASGTTAANEPTEANSTNVSGIPQMVFVDDEGLEEQFLTDGEDTANVLDTSANRVTTPVEVTHANQGTQQMQEEELDLQPSRGPREGSLVNTIDQFLDEKIPLHAAAAARCVHSFKVHFGVAVIWRNWRNLKHMFTSLFIYWNDCISFTMVQGLVFFLMSIKQKKRFSEVQTMIRNETLKLPRFEKRNKKFSCSTNHFLCGETFMRSVVLLHHRSISFENKEIVSLKFESLLSKIPRNDFRAQQH